VTKLTKAALDEQIDATVANEAKLLEEFGKAITIKDVQVSDAGKIIAEYDKIWLPKAPILADLRKLGAKL
jgi:predicted amidohydrolase